MTMSSIDLNIVHRGVRGTTWTAEKGKLDAASLSKVTEQRTDNGAALNALPTPFARFFMVKEAYRRLKEQRVCTKASQDVAGIAYERLVSDSLDVFELLFNKAYHEAKGEHIQVIEWHEEEDLRRLKMDVPKLGKTLENYINDVQGVNFSTLYFIVLETAEKVFLLGTSSPLTGFITPPDLDRTDKEGKTHTGSCYEKLPRLVRKGGHKEYFRQVCLFEDRSPEFKNYMFHHLCRKTVDDSLKELRDYIHTFANDPAIRNDYQERLQPILTDGNEELVVGGMPLSASDEVADYFTDILIRWPYPIAAENFVLPVYKGKRQGTPCDYLLPLSEEALKVLDLDKLDLEMNEKRDSVEVTLHTQGKTFTQKYETHPTTHGRLVELAHYGLQMDLALFPNLKVKDRPDSNRYYKLMLAAHQSQLSGSRFTIEDINCDFYVKDTQESVILIEEAKDENCQWGVRVPIVRSRQEEESDKSVSTKYYELFNTDYAAIRLNFQLEGEHFSGVLIPRWRIVQESDRSYLYAIDLGTTNTFVSRRMNTTDKNEPQQLCMTEPFVSYLHAKEPTSQKALVDRWEDNLPPQVEAAFHTEFLPSFIDGKRFRFPIRTAICETGQAQGIPNLFGHKNIAFSYGRKKESKGNTVNTRIKWETDESEQELRVFIRELLLMVKCDVLQQQGQVSATQLVWFRPLSFMRDAREMFDRLWNEEANQVLGIPPQQIVCYTESEAPYYYFLEKNVFHSVKSVAVVDIGGGSTDIVLFEQQEPRFANSVHFGCDVLWGNGFNNMQNAKDNGIFLAYKDKVKFDDKDLKAIYQEMKASDSQASTREIINFWLTNKDKIEVDKWLRKDFLPLFLYHYVAVMFYLATLFRSKRLNAPRSIVLSGNGSRYIDSYITNDTALLEEITRLIFRQVYKDDLQEALQIILPPIRKESTCYGGLFRPAGNPSPTPYLFMGVDDEQYKDIAELKEAFKETLCAALCRQIDSLNRVYLKVLSLIIQRLGMEGIDTSKVKELISGNVQDMLETNFKNQVEKKYNENHVYQDSLFFLPVVNIIYELTKLKE